MSSQVEFYHIDAFEAPNYEPIWRALVNGGVDARLVAVPGRENTAANGWFDYERLAGYYKARNVPFHVKADAAAVGVTTQNEDIITFYKGPHIRLMYGPVLFPNAWGFAEHAARPFDHILVHGQLYKEALSQFKEPSALHVIGYPKYDDYFSRKLDLADYRRAWALDPAKKTVVYVPTWGENTAWDLFFSRLSELQNRFNVLVKPHHCSLRMEPQRMRELTGSGVKMVESAYDLAPLMGVADVVLCDARSSVVGETLVLDRPAIALSAHENDRAEWIEKAGLTKLIPLCDAPSDLASRVEEVLSNDRFAASRAAWADRHVAFRDGSASQRAAEIIMQLVGHRPVTVSVPQVRSGPRVSVILPTYNHLTFLPASIKSVLDQTYQDFELVIVNDGSTDGTKEFLDSLNNPRIRVIHQANQRLPGALNTGFAQARGELFTWTSSDNVCSPVFLEGLVGALDAHPDAGLAISAFAYTDPEGRLLRINANQDLTLPSLLKANPGIASFLYRRTAYEKVGQYNPALEGAEDWDMWIRMVEYFPAVYVPEILYYYRQHASSMTGQIPDKIRRASARTVSEAFARKGNKILIDEFYPCLKDCANKAEAEAHAYFDLGTQMLCSPFAPPSIAANCLTRAFDLQPSLSALVNLAYALARASRWQQLKLCLSHLQGKQFPDTAVVTQNLTRVLQAQRPDLVELRRVFVLTPASSELLKRVADGRRVYSLTEAYNRLPTKPSPHAPKAPVEPPKPVPPVAPTTPPAGPAQGQGKEEKLTKLTGAIAQSMEHGDHHAAMRDLVEALTLSPDQPELLQTLGFVLFKVEEYDKAENIFKRLIKKNPSFAPGYQNLSQLYQHQGRLDEAEAVQCEGITTIPDDRELVRGLLPILVAREKFAEVLKLCDEILEQSPRDVDILLLKAKFHAKAGHIDDALETMIDALSIVHRSAQK